MKLEWTVSAADIAKVKSLMRARRHDANVKRRKAVNCASRKLTIDKKRFWEVLVATRLTSQQNSSPTGPVSRFVNRKPFPLSYDVVARESSAEALTAATLRKAGGIRFIDKIAREMAYNFDLLENGEWDDVLRRCNELTKPVSREKEVEVAAYMQAKFKGFGPKQSRNLLQALGLTRYEIPIDSRVTNWLNEFGFPVRLTATALADINYYNFVSDGIQLLCSKSGILPCLFDAAVFSTRDGDEWDEDNIF
jgi:hypothetical protein